jgi:hypothetical protein
MIHSWPFSDGSRYFPGCDSAVSLVKSPWSISLVINLIREPDPDLEVTSSDAEKSSKKTRHMGGFNLL